MDDTYVYVAVKLYLKPDQSEDSIQEIIQEMDYSFVHDDIIEHEIIEIIDTQIPSSLSQRDPKDLKGMPFKVDPFDLSTIGGE